MSLIFPITPAVPSPTSGEPCITFQIIDKDGDVLFDLDNPSGDGNPQGLATSMSPLDVGVLPVELATLNHGGGIPGASLSRRDLQFRTVAWTLAHTATTNMLPEELRTAMNELARLLELGSQTGNRIKVRPLGSMTDRYIRWLGTNQIAPLLAGQPDAVPHTYEVKDAKFNGYTPMTIIAQPLLEWDETNPLPVVISANPHEGRVLDIVNPGSAPARVRLVLDTIDTIERLLWGLFPGPAYDDLQEAEAALALGADTSVVTNLNAYPSGGANNALRTTFATDDDLVFRSQIQWDAPDGGGHRFLVVARVFSDGAYTGQMQMRSRPGSSLQGTGLGTPADEVDVTLVDAVPRDIALGVISLPEHSEVTTAVIEILASRTSGAGALFTDDISFVPLDVCSGDIALSPGLGPGDTLYLEPAGQGRPPFAGVSTSGQMYVTDFHHLNGDVGIWAPPGTSRLYVQINAETAAGQFDGSDRSMSVNVAARVTAHDLLT